VAGDFLLLLHGRPQNPRAGRAEIRDGPPRLPRGRREPTERRTGGRRLGLFSGRGGSPPGSGWGSNGEGRQGFKMAAPFYCLPVPDFPFPFRFLDSQLFPASRGDVERGGDHNE
jgi:hypothetical protein